MTFPRQFWLLAPTLPESHSSLTCPRILSLQLRWWATAAPQAASRSWCTRGYTTRICTTTAATTRPGTSLRRWGSKSPPTASTTSSRPSSSSLTARASLDASPRRLTKDNLPRILSHLLPSLSLHVIPFFRNPWVCFFYGVSNVSPSGVLSVLFHPCVGSDPKVATNDVA
uniref:Uncharacterized protein n=1 Tax=Ixodes scapularis TaxID=6945 RepID=A0A4D5RX70_IXOSC